MHCDNWKSQEKLWHFGGKILLWQCTAVVLRDCTTYIHHCGSWGRFCVWWWWWWCDFLVRCWRKYGGGGGRTPPPPTPQTALSSSLHSSVDIMYNALTTALCCTAAVQSTQLLTHIHTLCVSKRIQTYNTLGIHLQSVKISGISGISMSLHTNAQLEIFVFEPMRHNETNRISSLVYQWIPNYALIALNFTSRHRAWSMNNWSINPTFDVMHLPVLSPNWKKNPDVP